MKKYKLFTLIVILSVFLCGCKKKYAIDLVLFKQSFISSFNLLDSTQKKFYLQIYDTVNPLPFWYSSNKNFNTEIGIYRSFLDNSLSDHGINPQLFLKDSIYKLISSLDTAHIDYNKISKLDMMLSKSYYDYCSAMKYGCFNPRKLYPNEYFIDVKRPDENFIKTAFDKFDDPLFLQNYLDSIQPSGKIYKKMQQELKSFSKSKSTFGIISANMERLRWTPVRNISNKHIHVNVATAHLSMMRGDSVISTLRVGVGKSGEHETPLMIGDMYEIILNPTWTVPSSIVINEIVKKGAGIPSYMARNNMKIYKKGVIQNPCSIAWNTLTDKNQPYRIVQDSGESNSLGRIKFNFDNPFSVYLHDTDSKHIFNYDRRDVSHGCVRVQNPLRLAFFCLNDIDTTNKADLNKRKVLQDRMRYEIGIKPLSDDNAKIFSKSKNKLRYISLKPKVTILIDYHTCYFDNNGKLNFASDYYKMDDILIKKLNNISMKSQYKEKPKKDIPKKESVKQKKDSVKVAVQTEKIDSI